MKITLALSEKIEATLRDFVAHPEPYLIKFDEPLELRKLAAQLNVLPLILDMGGCYGIRPNGEIVSFNWDEPDKLEVENDPRIRNAALFQGTLKYPELKELVPSRPADAVDCQHCMGTGREPTNEKLGFDSDVILCYCGGMGWLPENVQKPFSVEHDP